MSCYVYVIKSKLDNGFYLGISENPKRRLAEHNAGKLKITSARKPFELVHIREHNDYASARKHEVWLKKKSRNYKNRLAQLAPPLAGGVK